MTRADLRQQPLSQLLQVLNVLYVFEAEGDDCSEEAKDVLGIVGATGDIYYVSAGPDAALGNVPSEGVAVAVEVKP